MQGCPTISLSSSFLQMRLHLQAVPHAQNCMSMLVICISAAARRPAGGLIMACRTNLLTVPLHGQIIVWTHWPLTRARSLASMPISLKGHFASDHWLSCELQAVHPAQRCVSDLVTFLSPPLSGGLQTASKLPASKGRPLSKADAEALAKREAAKARVQQRELREWGML